MTLRDLTLKHEYRSDRDNLISEFFSLCLNNCIQYDRSVEFVTAKSFAGILHASKNIANAGISTRIVTGNRFRPEDLSLLTAVLDDIRKNKKPPGDNSSPAYDILRKILQDKKLEIKIAIPRSSSAAGFFAENVGIFRDSEGNAVAFRGSSSEMFSNGNFESIDVFTSWDEKSRVERKIQNFEDLWNDRTAKLKVHDFADAQRNKLLKYDFQELVNRAL